VSEPEEFPIDELRRRIRIVWPKYKVAQWEKHYGGCAPAEQKAMERALTDRMFDL